APRPVAVVWDGIAENPVGRSKPIATRWRVVAVVVIVAVEVRVLRARWIPSCGGAILCPRQANTAPHQKRPSAKPPCVSHNLLQSEVGRGQRTSVAKLPMRLAARGGDKMT